MPTDLGGNFGGRRPGNAPYLEYYQLLSTADYGKAIFLKNRGKI